MKLLVLCCFLVLLYINAIEANDLIVGTGYNGRLIWQQKAEYMGIPFKKRVKEVFYSDPSQQIIKGVIAKEVDKTGASAIITAGGVGYSYVNIRFKSERGSALNYFVEIYV